MGYSGICTAAPVEGLRDCRGLMLPVALGELYLAAVAWGPILLLSFQETGLVMKALEKYLSN